MGLNSTPVVGAALLAVSVSLSIVHANDEVMKLSEDPANWAMPTGDYANTRYSKLDEINADNAGELSPVWTFSTCLLYTSPSPRDRTRSRMPSSA